MRCFFLDLNRPFSPINNLDVLYINIKGPSGKVKQNLLPAVLSQRSELNAVIVAMVIDGKIRTQTSVLTDHKTVNE